MNKLHVYDNLKLENDNIIKSLINNEKIFFSGRINKINKMNFQQSRIFIITENNLYNIEKNKINRKFAINKIQGISISKKSEQFILHGSENEYDYLLTDPNRFLIIKILSTIYTEKTGKKMVFSIINHKSLNNYVVLKSDRKKNLELNKIEKNNLMSIDEYIQSNGNLNLNSHEKINHYFDIFNNNKYKNEKIENFNFIKILCKGSTSTIYYANYKIDNKNYALKVIDKYYLISNYLIDQIYLEKNLLSFLNKNFISEIYFYFMTETKIIFVLPFYQGGDLLNLIQKKIRIDEDLLRFYAVQIANMLNELHKINIMYRDLKPENLMINDDGYLKLIDFGCAKIIENDELSCSLIGNPYYMSPEIISGEGHNFSTDWWSFGVILYELFFGVPPFNDRNLERNFDLIRNCNVIFPSNKFISKELKDLIMKLLEKNKEKRLGFKNGFNEIIQHQFFKNGANIINILNKSLIPSFKPNNEKLFENFDEIYTNLEINMNEIYENEKIQNLQKYESLFEIFIKK